ncbi:MAG: hypothetical protein KUG80_06620 [Gammaproteobacteria bacterium]|nr:hypothetical protein [Gammaproteobacteria bacterium]
MLADNVWHVLSSFLVFYFGIFFFILMAKKFEVGQKRALFLYFWHMLFCFVYFVFSMLNVADSTTYYQKSLSYDQFGLGTDFVVYFVSLFSKYLGFSYVGVFLVFNVIGTLGLLAFYGSLNSIVVGMSRRVQWMALLVILLPSTSFWSSAIGKEPFAFLSIGFALWASLDLRNRFGFMAFSIVVMLLVRPHMAGMLLMALSAAMLFDKNVKFVGKAALLLLTFIVACMIVPLAIKYAGLNELGQIAQYIEKRQGYNQGGGSSLDISGMSLPMQLFTYAFRPLPYEAHSVTALFSSLDNFYLLFVFLLAIYNSIQRKPCSSSANVAFLMGYLGISWVILAMTTPNLGIAVRQKWMFMPFLIFICFLYIGRQRSFSMWAVDDRIDFDAYQVNSGHLQQGK